MQDKPVALVTGANRGIGFQIAKDLAAHSFTVLVGSRNLEHGGRAAASIEGDARVLQLDVTDPASIDAAAERIRHELGRLDVPVNNAGIMDAERPGDTLEEQLNAGRLSAVALDEVRTVFDTNVFASLRSRRRCSRCCAKRPRRASSTWPAPAGRSRSAPTQPTRAVRGSGPMRYRRPPSTPSHSPPTLNRSASTQLSRPGRQSTGLNNFLGTRSVEQAAREPVRLALLDASGPTGTFSNEDGPIPW